MIRNKRIDMSLASEMQHVSSSKGFDEKEMSPFAVYFKQTIPVNIHHFYINKTIDQNHHYIDLFNTLKTATPNDTIYLYINNQGGLLSTTYQLINSINSTQAMVITVLEGGAHSAASMLFLSGHKKIVGEHADMLCHYFSGGMFGKGHEIEAQAEFYAKSYKNFMRKIYADFLQEDEIERLIEGKDFWLSAEDIAERLGLEFVDEGFYTDIEAAQPNITDSEMAAMEEALKKASALKKEEESKSKPQKRPSRKKTTPAKKTE